LQRKWNQKTCYNNLYSITKWSCRKNKSDHYELGAKYALEEEDTTDVLARSSELNSIYFEPKPHFGNKKYNSKGGLEWNKTFS